MSSDWQTVELADIADLSMGETLLSKNLTGDGIPVFSANTDEGPWGYTSTNRRRLDRGDIVIGARGSIGFPRRPNFDAFTCTQTTIAVQPGRAVVDSEYLHHALCAADILGIASQQAVPMLTIGALSQLVIALPMLEEQRRIAEVLRSMDEAIQLEREVKSASESSLAHALDALLPTEAETAGEGWSQTTIGEFSTVVTGKTPSTKDWRLWGGDIPFVTPTDMDGTVWSVRAARTVTRDALKHTKVAPINSVLFTCIASIGKLCLNNEPVAFNQQINACICDNSTDAEFLYWMLRRLTPRIKSMCGTTAVPIINKRAFSEISIPIPPAAKRAEVVEILSHMGRLVEASAETLGSLRCLQERVASDLLSARARVPA
jgi:restriction endonuclease S subunit